MLKIKTKTTIKYLSRMKNACLSARRGSVLAYALIIISVMIVIVSSISVITVIEKKGAVSTNSSAQAFQVADSGAQLAIKKINANIQNNASTLASTFGSCTGTGVVEENMTGTLSTSIYKLTFKDSSGNDLGCNALIKDVDRIKSIGTYKDTVRAVEVTMSAKPCGADTVCSKSCSYNGDTYSTVLLGSQCWFRENLRTKLKPNGDPVDYWCYGTGFPASGCTDKHDGMTYGMLYQWHGANNLDASCMNTSCTPPSPNRGICPAGWHIPKVAEFNTLIASNNGIALRNVDSAYFSGILAGVVLWVSGDRDVRGLWWSSEENGYAAAGPPLNGCVLGSFLNLYRNDVNATMPSFCKGMAVSVRCIQDN